MGAFEYDHDTLLLAIVSYTDPSCLAPTNARKFVFQESQTRAIAWILTRLINQFGYICEGHAHVMGVYCIKIIIKILRKHIFIDRIFHDRCCQIILCWQLNEPPNLVGQFPWRIHSFRQLWNFHVQFKWRHAQRWRVFPGGKCLETGGTTHKKQEQSVTA